MGRLIKNRTFWFANYEQVQELLARTSISTVLSPNARLGLLSTGTVTVDPSITQTLGLMQLPNRRFARAGRCRPIQRANEQTVQGTIRPRQDRSQFFGIRQLERQLLLR